MLTPNAGPGARAARRAGADRRVRPHRCPGITARGLLCQSVWLAVEGTLLILFWHQGIAVMGATGSISALATYVVASRYLDAGVTLADTASFGLRPGLSALANDPAAMRAALRRYVGLALGVGARLLVALPFRHRWAGTVTGVAASLVLVWLNPGALAPMLGTVAGVSVLALVWLAGLRDLLVRRAGGAA